MATTLGCNTTVMFGYFSSLRFLVREFSFLAYLKSFNNSRRWKRKENLFLLYWENTWRVVDAIQTRSYGVSVYGNFCHVMYCIIYISMNHFSYVIFYCYVK